MNRAYEYRLWLEDQIDAKEGGEHGYSVLCGKLHDTPFLPYLEMDWNRNDDALELRQEWAATITGDSLMQAEIISELDEEFNMGFCTMLELLVVLVRRIQYETMDSEHEANVRKWFIELIENCGLYEWNDEAWAKEPIEADERTGDILGMIVFREYGWDGEGGLFPLNHCTCDQRDTELLTQMNYYIEENYDIC